MIKYDLKEEKYKNHELDCKWAKLLTSPIYRNNLCTVVDNHREVINGRYTGEQSTLLLHLTPNIRRYVTGAIFKDFLYVGIYNDKCIPTYTNWEYAYREISTEEATSTLFEILYDVEPLLHSRTLAGGSKDEILDERNTYNGEYILNDEEIYRITRRGEKIRFYKLVDDSPVEIYNGELDIDKFKQAVNKYWVKSDICSNVDKWLVSGELSKKIQEFEQL